MNHLRLAMLRAAVVLLTALWTSGVATAARSYDQLSEDVTGLGLTYRGYTLGTSLTEAQQAFARQHLADSSYEGTYTFADEELHVVARGDTHQILALYQRFEDVDQDRVKSTVGDLMATFGEPTNLAHDAIIYWSYSPKGKMTGEAFEQAKDNADGVIDIIATIKLNSSRPIEAADSPATIYWILSSNPMLKQFIEGA